MSVMTQSWVFTPSPLQIPSQSLVRNQPIKFHLLSLAPGLHHKTELPLPQCQLLDAFPFSFISDRCISSILQVGGLGVISLGVKPTTRKPTLDTTGPDGTESSVMRYTSIWRRERSLRPPAARRVDDRN